MNVLYQDDIDKILGKSQDIVFLGGGATRHKYHINEDITLCISYSSKQTLYHIRWYGKDHAALDLNNIFKDLPMKWQNRVIFNMDIFQCQGFVDGVFGTLAPK